MKAASNANTFFGWSTRMNGNKFEAVITKNISRTEPNESGRYCDTEVVIVAAFSTRAKAMGYAKKAVRYYSANA